MPHSPISEGHRAGLDDLIAAYSSAGVGAGHADRGDPGLGQALQLARVRYAIPVKVAPDLQRAESAVLGIHLAVVVRVERPERVETGLCGRPEQLRNIVNHAVPVAVDREQAVVRLHPTRLLGESVAVQVKIGIRVSAGNQFHSVAVKVDH